MSKPRMRSYKTSYGNSQLVVRQGSNGKRRCATKFLVCLYITNATSAVRPCGNHITKCCLADARIELTIVYSVNIGDVTNELHEERNQDVDSVCEVQWFTEEGSVGPRRCGHTRAVSACTVFACCACDTGARERLTGGIT